MPWGKISSQPLEQLLSKIQLWHVCLAGKYQTVRRKKRSLQCVISFFLFLFFFFACSIDLSLNKPSISSISNVKGSLFHTCDHSLQKPPCKLSPLSCCIIWSAIFPHVTLLCDQDRHGVYACWHLLNYSKAPLSLHVPFLVVLGWDKRPVNLHIACLGTNACWWVGWWWWRSEENGRWRGTWGKRWVGKEMCMCICVCVRLRVDLPTLHLFVSLCGAVVSAGGGHVKSQTLASRMAPLPGFSQPQLPPPHPSSSLSLALCLPGLQLKTHIFSLWMGV